MLFPRAESVIGELALHTRQIEIFNQARDLKQTYTTDVEEMAQKLFSLLESMLSEDTSHICTCH